MSLSLYHISNEYQQALLAFDGIEDAEGVAEALAELKGEVADKARAVGAYLLNLQAEAQAMKDAELAMAARRKSAESKVKRLKEYLRDNMQECEISKISCPEFAISLRKPSKRVEVTAVELLPESLVTVKTTTAPDKTAIGKLLKAGESVPGACLVDGQASLIIK